MGIARAETGHDEVATERDSSSTPSPCLDHRDETLVEIIEMLLGLDAQRGNRIAAHIHRGWRCGSCPLEAERRRRRRTIAPHVEQLIGALLQAAVAGAATSATGFDVAAVARIAIGVGIGNAEVLR